MNLMEKPTYKLFLELEKLENVLKENIEDFSIIKKNIENALKSISDSNLNDIFAQKIKMISDIIELFQNVLDQGKIFEST